MLLRLHLDVAALDVAAPGVGAVGAPKSSMEKPSPGDLRARAAWLTLVEHLDDEPAVPQVAQGTPGVGPCDR